MAVITFIRQGDGWMSKMLPSGEFSARAIPEEELIEARAKATQKTGEHPLWEGYSAIKYRKDLTRSSNNVRTSIRVGRFFAWLAAQRKPKSIVEFGTAFGVSGMYWLAGLKRVPGGRLYTFEPNSVWAKFANENLTAISSSFTLTNGTFEENAGRVLNEDGIDLAFIDAIHTSEFVLPQFEIVRRLANPGAIVVFDDISFSRDMMECWTSIASMPDLLSSATFGSRLGIVEL